MSYYNRDLKWYQRITLMHGLAALIALVICFAVYAIWYEATFDYQACRTTDTYREQHRAAYTSYMTINNVMIPTHHPEQNWTERLYDCPKGRAGSGERFDKWRRENQP